MKKTLLKALPMLFVGLLFALQSMKAQTNYYVNASRPDDLGDGLSLATAKKTIQAAVNIASNGDVVNVSAGITYSLTTAININKQLTLRGNDLNLAVKPIITGSTGAIINSGDRKNALIEVDAPNVKIQNFEFQINQEPTYIGISSTTTDNFNNLEISDNVFKGTKAQTSTGYAWYSQAIRLGRGSAGIVGGVSNNMINIVRNQITYADLGAPELFGRGIYAFNTYGKIGGSNVDKNTIAAVYALQGGELGGGAGNDFEFSYNDVPGGVVSVVGAEAGNHKLSNNNLGAGITLAHASDMPRSVEVKGSRNANANIEIADNTILNYVNIGVFIQHSNNVTVKNNVLTPLQNAVNTDFVSIAFSSKEGTSAAQAAVTSENITIVGNTFNSNGNNINGKGVAFFNHNASAGVPPLVNGKIGGLGMDKNNFNANLAYYIFLDATSGGDTQDTYYDFFYDIVQNATNKTNILPFSSNVDAEFNIFGAINTEADKTPASLLTVKTKIYDKDDAAGVGEVFLYLPIKNINTLEGFVSIQEAIDDTDTQDGHAINVDAGTYILTTAITVNKSLSLIGNNNILANKPIINGVGNVTAKSLIEVDAPNVTIQNLELYIAQDGDALNGIASLSTDNFDNLTIKNNIFRGIKTDVQIGYVWDSHAIKLGRLDGAAKNEVTVEGNEIIYGHPTLFQLFGRGIYAYNVYGKIGGSSANKNTISAIYALHGGVIGGGSGSNFEFSYNDIPYGLVSVVGAAVGEHKINNNTIGSGIPDKATADQTMRLVEIKGSRTVGADIEIANNTIVNYTNIGIFIQRSNNVTIKNNTLIPFQDAANTSFASIAFSSKEGTGGPQSAVTSENLSIVGNTFNGNGSNINGTGITFFNHNALASVSPLINAKVGGLVGADKNTFSANLAYYVALDATAGGDTQSPSYDTLYDIVQDVANKTNILPFNSDIDAAYNDFGGVDSETADVPTLASIKSKVLDNEDNGVLGSVNIVPIVLPIDLISFTAQVATGGALLKWTTGSESNNAKFEVEKSIDGKNFFVIDSRKGQGNSTVISSYEFLDVSFKQSAYYRLAQVDVGGKRKVYDDLTKFVKGLDNSLSVVAYPNPVAAKLYVTVSSANKENVKLLLNDLTGKTLKVKTADSSQLIELDVAGIATGSYILQVIKDSGNVSKKILKL